jgi:hypothetical protein
MSINEAVRELCHFIFLRHTRTRRRGRHDDYEEDVDDINHVVLPKETVRANSPGKRAQRTDIRKLVSRIANHDVSDHGMKADCTHVCVYRLSDGEEGDNQIRDDGQ